MTTAVEITCPHCANLFSVYTHNDSIDLNRIITYYRFDEAPLSVFTSLVMKPLQCPSCKQICTIKATVWVE